MLLAGSAWKRRENRVLPTSKRLQAWLEKHVPPECRLADPDGALFKNPDGYQDGALRS